MSSDPLRIAPEAAAVESKTPPTIYPELAPILKAGTKAENGLNVDLSPLLLTAKQSAAICGKSLRTWRTWDSAGWIPQPIRIGRSTLWRADELRDWVAAGCPRREEWQEMQDANNRARHEAHLPQRRGGSFSTNGR